MPWCCASLASRSRIVLVAVLLASGAAIHADQTAADQAIREADRLRNAGQLTAAVELLRSQLSRQPDDGGAARMLAQTLYWLHDVQGARAVYDAALTRHPEDTTLRLQYARMLLETREWGRIPSLVEPLQRSPATRPEATALLGTLAYWQGDLTRARRLFRDTLALDPSHPDARRQLQEINAASAAWVRVAASARHDDQPLDRVGGGVEAGWYLTPLVPITVRTEPIAYRPNEAATTRLWSTEAAIGGYAPASRLEFDAGGGVLTRPGQATREGWVGHAALGLRPASSLVVRGRVERRPYLNTSESIDRPVAVRAVAGAVAWTDPRGWLAEATFERQLFPDDNVVRSASAWLLAPIVHRPRGDLQAGYAFGYATSDESRFVLATTRQSVPAIDPRFDLSGRYSPYFTPDDQRTHAIAVAATIRGANRARVSLGGSVPLHATERAPVFVVVNGVPARKFYERSYSPWTARGAVTVPVGTRVSVGFSGETGRTAFYEWVQGEVTVTYTFLPRTAVSP